MSYLPPHIISKSADEHLGGTSNAEDDASRFNVLRGAKKIVHQTAGAVQHVTSATVEHLNHAAEKGVDVVQTVALNAANTTSHAVQHCANSTVGIVESTVDAVQHLGSPLQNYGTLSSQSEIAPIRMPSESTTGSSYGFDLSVFDVTSERPGAPDPQWGKTSMQSLGDLNRYVVTGVGGVSSALAKGAVSAAGGATDVVSSVGDVASTAVVKTASAVGNTASAVGNATAAAVTTLLDTTEDNDENDKVDTETTRKMNQEERLQNIIAKRHDDETLSKLEEKAELMNGCKSSLQQVLTSGVSTTDGGEGEDDDDKNDEGNNDKEGLCRKITENRLINRPGRVRRTHSPKRCCTSGTGGDAADRVRAPTRSRSSTPRRCQSDARNKASVSRSRSTSPRRGDRARATRSRESSTVGSGIEDCEEPISTNIKSEHTARRNRSRSPTTTSRSQRGGRSAATTPRSRGNADGSEVDRIRSNTRKVEEGDKSRTGSRSRSRSRSSSPTRNQRHVELTISNEASGLESLTHQSATTPVRRSRSRSPASGDHKAGSRLKYTASKGRGRSRSESPKRKNGMTVSSNQNLHQVLYGRPANESEEDLPNFSLAVDIDDDIEEEELGETISSHMTKPANDDQLKMGMSTLLDESLKSNYDEQISSSSSACFGHLAEEEPMLLVSTL